MESLIINAEFFAQRIQCARNDKQECLRTIYLLAEVSYAFMNGGIRAVDSLISSNTVKYSEVFLNRALQLFIDAKNVDQIRTVLYNTIMASNFIGQQFLNGVIITEALASLFDHEDIDFIFTFLVPSYFGLDYEENARQAYRDFRTIKLQEHPVSDDNH